MMTIINFAAEPIDRLYLWIPHEPEAEKKWHGVPVNLWPAAWIIVPAHHPARHYQPG
jgi:hypothetical protein